MTDKGKNYIGLPSFLRNNNNLTLKTGCSCRIAQAEHWINPEDTGSNPVAIATHRAMDFYD